MRIYVCDVGIKVMISEKEKNNLLVYVSTYSWIIKEDFEVKVAKKKHLR